MASSSVPACQQLTIIIWSTLAAVLVDGMSGAGLMEWSRFLVSADVTAERTYRDAEQEFVDWAQVAPKAARIIAW